MNEAKIQISFIPVNKYPAYRISNKGDVWSFKSNRQLKKKLDWQGYYQVQLWNDGGGKHVKLAKLVLENFTHNREPRMEVNHINGVKNDDRLENLEWVTRSENEKHAYLKGLQKPRRGELSGRSKLTQEEVVTARYYMNELGCNVSEMAKIFNVGAPAMSFIKNRINWSHI